MHHKSFLHTTMRESKRIVSLFVLCQTFTVGAMAQSASSAQPASTQRTAATAQHSRYKPTRFPKRANMYYESVWGIDSIGVRTAESGELIRFNYRVVNADKAKPLNDKKAEPTLIDPKAGVKLIVPTMEKVGQLRQTAPPEAGKVYWMAFSNKGRVVKKGDRVNVTIGKFHADNLVVE